MKTIFEEIIENKKEELLRKEKSVSMLSLSKKTKHIIDKNQYRRSPLISGLTNPKLGDIGIVGEIKLKSSSTGQLGNINDAVSKVLRYQQGYADAVSVVTDNKYFGGSLSLFTKIRNLTGLPMLLKDFIIDQYQVYEAVCVGADAILLISKLKKYYTNEFMEVLAECAITPVVEISRVEELDFPLTRTARVVAVNARNLDTFEVDVEKACQIIKKIPKNKLIIGFSGVHSRDEVVMYKNAGAHTVLVGTTLMKSERPDKLIHLLKGL